MKAIAIVPKTTHVALIERPEPTINEPNEVKIKVLEVGICGTDREEVAGGRAEAPASANQLIIGHEMCGIVTETGAAVTKVRPGDYAVFTVRRGCGKCAACLNNRSDMCYTGLYTERGIKGADGYQAEFVVDQEKYIVKVPETIKDIAVLTEPMSVAAKAIDEALIIQGSRLKAFDNIDKWFNGKKALIVGIGPIGILAAFALRLRGADVYGLDIVPPGSIRPKILEQIGGIYIDGNSVGVEDVDDKITTMDFAFEATGIAKLQIQIIDTLAVNAIYVATGIPGGTRPLTLNGGTLMQQLVLKNQVIVGSVNAGIEHYTQAVEYLEKSKKLWPQAIEKVITNRVHFTEYNTILHEHTPDEIKAVVSWQ